MRHGVSKVMFREYVSRKIVATFYVDSIPREGEYVRIGTENFKVSQVHHEYTEVQGTWDQMTVVTLSKWEFWID